METILKFAPLVSASCALFMVLWNIVPAAWSKMTTGTLPTEVAATPWWKRQITIMSVLLLLTWIPIFASWIYGGGPTRTPVTSPQPSLTPQPQIPSTDRPSTSQTPVPSYYTRQEIDSMINTLVELQRVLKAKPAPNDAVQKMIARRTGILVAPNISEYRGIADGLEQYAEGLRKDTAEIKRLTSGADEFVKSVAPEETHSTDQFYRVLLDSAEALRHASANTTDNVLATAAINPWQRQVSDQFAKYSDSISSSQQKIADKITDLRSR